MFRSRRVIGWNWDIVSESEAEYDQKFIPDSIGSDIGQPEEIRLKTIKKYLKDKLNIRLYEDWGWKAARTYKLRHSTI